MGVTIFIIGKHIVPVLSFHHPDFRICRLKASHGALDRWLLRVLIRLFPGRDDADGVAVFINVLDAGLLEMFRRVHPRWTILLRLHDLVPEADVGRFSNLCQRLLRERVVDRVETYCRYDADRFHIAYSPNRVHVEALRRMQSESCLRDYLASFVGSVENIDRYHRMQYLERIRTELLRHYPNAQDAIFYFIHRDAKQYLKYEDSLLVSRSSRIVVDLIRLDEREGYSYRVPEALAMGRKVITNRADIRNEGFYHPSRIFICGVDDWGRLKEFVESEFLALKPEEVADIDSRRWSQALNHESGSRDHGLPGVQSQ